MIYGLTENQLNGAKKSNYISVKPWSSGAMLIKIRVEKYIIRFLNLTALKKILRGFYKFLK